MTLVFTTSLSVLRLIGTAFSLFTSNYYKLFKLVLTVSNLAIFDLSTSSFKLTKSTFFANDYVSTPVAFLHEVF